MELLCSNCRLWKPETEFWRDRSRKRGRYYECKTCAYTPTIKSDYKTCNKCGERLPKSEFYLCYHNNEGRYYYHQPCRACKSEVNARRKAGLND